MSSICDALLAREIVIIMTVLILFWYITNNVFKTPTLYEGFEASIDYDTDQTNALVQYTDDKINRTAFDMIELVPDDPRTALKTKSFDYPLDGGIYGDVQIYAYGPNDVPFRSEWQRPNAIYMPNSMLYYEKNDLKKLVSD